MTAIPQGLFNLLAEPGVVDDDLFDPRLHQGTDVILNQAPATGLQ